MGKTILDWQIQSLRAAGISDIHVVTGYRSENINRPDIGKIHNPDWASTNMIQSLLTAAKLIIGPTIVSYSDILYGSDTVDALASTPTDWTVAYDTNWLQLWRARFDNPLEDAETFRISPEGLITDIGGKTDKVEDIQGQYIGLNLLTPLAMGWIREVVDALPLEKAARLDMTSLMSLLIDRGYPLHGAPISFGWCEIDTPRDLKVGRSLLQNRRIGDLAP